jgi:hypothetical protein
MEVEKKDLVKLDQQKEERTKLQRRIANDWKTFSKTAAYKDLQEYMESNMAMLLEYSQDMVMPSPVGKGEEIIIPIEKAHSLLQNRRGLAIVKTYVDGYVNLTT